MRLVMALVLAFAVCVPAIAAAQDGGGYAGASGTLTIQSADTPVGSGPSIPKPGISGHAFGIAGEFGGFVAPAVSVGGEVSWPMRYTSVQRTGYFLPTITRNDHRDVVLSAVAGVHLPHDGRVRAAFVGGTSLVREDTNVSRAVDTGSPLQPSGIYGPFVAGDPLKAWRFGITSGFNLEVRAGRRVSVVSGLRMHYIWRDGGTDVNNVLLQMSNWLFVPSFGLRAAF